ncbi:hypothetical protein F5X96DRAFT_654092 [Biscogniauxia mediterranea]|nr:hypothetical protein F5X96DRAFT_654092 [Biscogniauxia mediterranea]
MGIYYITRFVILILIPILIALVAILSSLLFTFSVSYAFRPIRFLYLATYITLRYSTRYLHCITYTYLYIITMLYLHSKIHNAKVRGERRNMEGRKKEKGRD